MNLTDYLRRIGLSYPPEPTAENLRLFQSQHLYTVPYENLDIIDRKPFTLDLEDIYDKVVMRGRGGYCFELNGLFAWMLGELGYKVTELFARFLRGEIGIPKRRHRILLVETEGKRYICDVGVGGVSPRFPLELVCDVVQDDLCGERYRIVGDGLVYTIEEYREGWSPYYSFTLEPQLPCDFIAIDYWCQNHPDSIFRQKVMGAIKTPTGGTVLSGDSLKVYDNGLKEELTVTTKAEMYAVYERYFGVK